MSIPIHWLIVMHYSSISVKNNTEMTDSPIASKQYLIDFYAYQEKEKGGYSIMKTGNQWLLVDLHQINTKKCLVQVSGFK